MQHVLKNNRPTSYIISFLNNVDKFTIFDNKGKVYYYRYLPYNERDKPIKVNIPDPGLYYFSNDAIIKEKPLIVTPEVFKIRLPQRERNRDKSYFIEHDPNQTESPAIIYTDIGRIVTGTKFKELPIPMKIFVLLHEIGHFRYSTERFCDLYATIEFIKLGYNPSTAMYCLTDVLKNSNGKTDRVNYIFDILKQNNIVNGL